MKVTVTDYVGIVYDVDVELDRVTDDGMVELVGRSPIPFTEMRGFSIDVLPARTGIRLIAPDDQP